MADKKQSGAPSASHKKTTARQAVRAERHKGSGDRYSVEALRANMSTGGGEPIDPGKKWTTERRVLQPRDPDTGHFTYNADADYGLKYPQRGKGVAPIGARGWVLGNGIKKGDKVNIDGKVWIAIRDIPLDEVVDYFKHFDETKGEHFSKQGRTDGRATGLSSNFARKRGRQSKAEQAGIASGQRVLGQVDMSSLSKTTKAEIAQKFTETAKGFQTESMNTVGLSKISQAQQAANKAHNARVDAQRAAQAQAQSQAQAQAKPQPKSLGGGSQGSSAPTAPTTPTQPTQPTQPAAPQQGSKTGTSKTTFNKKKAVGLGNLNIGGLLGKKPNQANPQKPASAGKVKKKNLLGSIDLSKAFGGGQ